jgi:hypothetical protein
LTEYSKADDEDDAECEGDEFPTKDEFILLFLIFLNEVTVLRYRLFHRVVDG